MTIHTYQSQENLNHSVGGTPYAFHMYVYGTAAQCMRDPDAAAAEGGCHGLLKLRNGEIMQIAHYLSRQLNELFDRLKYIQCVPALKLTIFTYQPNRLSQNSGRLQHRTVLSPSSSLLSSPPYREQCYRNERNIKYGTTLCM